MGILLIMTNTDQKRTIRIAELKNPVVFMALGLGSGLAPKAPGTAGTLIAIPFYLLLQNMSLSLYAAITIVVTVFGVWICSYSSKKLGVHDHPAIVIDEIAGFLITMFAVPTGWIWVVVGFILFRFFDVLKPWPISWLDKNLSGGTGIMLDDVAAGLASLALIHGYLFLAGVM
jgi:phosphatidylglycerophosphatase A